MENVKAYPSGQNSTIHNPYAEALNEGMDLRDYFAGQALAGLMACGVTIDIDKSMPFETRAVTCYAIADAMMKARSK